MGSSTFIISPGSREAWYSWQHKKSWSDFPDIIYHSDFGDSRWEFICSGSALTYPEPEALNRPLETLRAWVKISEERLVNSQSFSMKQKIDTIYRHKNLVYDFY